MKISIVIVTYNRLNKLNKALDCYDDLTTKPQNIIVVNNNSSDGTKNYLEKWLKIPSSYQKHVLNLQENKGGSGGFFEGQKYALGLNSDWVMLADDDAYPQKDLLEQFNTFVSTHKTNYISAICSTVLHPDGSIDTKHRSYYRLIKGLFYERWPSDITDYNKEWFEIDYLSFVGCFIKTEALCKVGLVNPEFFIYSDDTEHSIRLKKAGKIVCVPKLKIIHDEQLSNNNTNVSWKDYYGFRNEIVMLKKHHFLSALFWSRHQYKILKSQTEKFMIFKTAMKDAWLGKLGVHPIYKPGWSAQK